MIDYTVQCTLSIFYYNNMSYSQTTAFNLLNEPHQRRQNLESTEVLPVALTIH